MRNIYELASRVVAWIGPEKEDSSVAMSTPEYLGKQLELTTDGYILPSPDVERKTWYMKDVNLPYSQDLWNALSFFVNGNGLSDYGWHRGLFLPIILHSCSVDSRISYGPCFAVQCGA